MGRGAPTRPGAIERCFGHKVALEALFCRRVDLVDSQVISKADCWKSVDQARMLFYR